MQAALRDFWLQQLQMTRAMFSQGESASGQFSDLII